MLRLVLFVFVVLGFYGLFFTDYGHTIIADAASPVEFSDYTETPITAPGFRDPIGLDISFNIYTRSWDFPRITVEEQDSEGGHDTVYCDLQEVESEHLLGVPPAYPDKLKGTCALSHRALAYLKDPDHYRKIDRYNNDPHNGVGMQHARLCFNKDAFVPDSAAHAAPRCEIKVRMHTASDTDGVTATGRDLTAAFLKGAGAKLLSDCEFWHKAKAQLTPEKLEAYGFAACADPFYLYGGKSCQKVNRFDTCSGDVHASGPNCYCAQNAPDLVMHYPSDSEDSIPADGKAALDALIGKFHAASLKGVVIVSHRITSDPGDKTGVATRRNFVIYKYLKSQYPSIGEHQFMLRDAQGIIGSHQENAVDIYIQK
jgi:hypothetical protein